MKQAFHIFRKDTRHLWREILVILVIASIYCMGAPKYWQLVGETAGAASGGFILTPIVFLAFPLLITIAWCLFSIRLIHEDGPVGDRQFWITRPYGWPNLFAAKMVSVFAWITLPILLIDCILLLHFGFSLVSSLPGIAFQQYLLFASVLFPILVLATVTENIPQFFLAALFLVIVSAFIPHPAGVLSTLLWMEESVTNLIYFPAALFILSRQFRRRTTNMSRWAILGVLAFTEFTTFLVPWNRVVNWKYPIAGNALLTFDPAFKPIYDTGGLSRNKFITIAVPLKISHLNPNLSLAIDGKQYTLETPDGHRWKSGWITEQTYLASPLIGYFYISLEIPRTFYESIAGTSVTLHLALAAKLAQAEASTTLTLSKDFFPVAGIGFCSAHFGNIACMSPLRAPERVRVSTDWSGTPCHLHLEGQTTNSSPYRTSNDQTSSVNSDPMPAISRFSPLAISHYQFPSKSVTNGDTTFVCPGTNVTFTVERTTQRLQQILTIPNLHLADYLRPVATEH